MNECSPDGLTEVHQYGFAAIVARVRPQGKQARVEWGLVLIEFLLSLDDAVEPSEVARVKPQMSLVVVSCITMYDYMLRKVYHLFCLHWFATFDEETVVPPWEQTFVSECAPYLDVTAASQVPSDDPDEEEVEPCSRVPTEVRMNQYWCTYLKDREVIILQSNLCAGMKRPTIGLRLRCR